MADVTLEAEGLAALRRLALRGMVADLDPEAGKALEAAGLATYLGAGWMITEDGLATQARLLNQEQAGLDLDALAQPYQRFLKANSRLKALAVSWYDAGDDDRLKLLDDVAALVRKADGALRATAEVVPRFAGYRDRLGKALERAEGGALDYVVSPMVDSVHTVWMECHEDFLQTLGIDREEEGSF